jgi:hypothetical protein
VPRLRRSSAFAGYPPLRLRMRSPQGGLICGRA